MGRDDLVTHLIDISTAGETELDILTGRIRHAQISQKEKRKLEQACRIRRAELKGKTRGGRLYRAIYIPPKEDD